MGVEEIFLVFSSDFRLGQNLGLFALETKGKGLGKTLSVTR